METFTVDPHSWKLARIFGRNALLRCTDRIEALVTVFAMALSLLAIPLAGSGRDDLQCAGAGVHPTGVAAARGAGNGDPSRDG